MTAREGIIVSKLVGSLSSAKNRISQYVQMYDKSESCELNGIIKSIDEALDEWRNFRTAKEKKRRNYKL